jgi:hypothetical protein
MPEPSLPLLPALLTLHGAPVLVLTALTLAVWIAPALNDGSSPLTAILTAALLLMFAIQLALLLAPRF